MRLTTEIFRLRYFGSVILIAMFVADSTAATRIVGKSPSHCAAQYSTITDALNASASGDTIEVCPGLYDEQLVISKPVTIKGIAGDGQKRVQIQPSTLATVSGTDVLAAVSVLNTPGVSLRNVAIDAGNNSVSGCTPVLAAVHFLNARGEIANDAISGAKTSDPASCATLDGNGFGILLESSGTNQSTVNVSGNSIHDYTKDGIRAIGVGLIARINGNVVSGTGPAGGFSFQFGIFVRDGAVGLVQGNQISEGDCGNLSIGDCFNARSEGIVLRAVGDGSVVDHNTITRAQSGIFVNFANKARITNNLVADIAPADAIDAQGMSNSLLDANTIYNATPPSNQSCGVAEFPGPGSAGGIESNNIITHTLVNDAWCGIAFDPSSHLSGNDYHNVTFTQFRSDVGPSQ